MPERKHCGLDYARNVANNVLARRERGILFAPLNAKRDPGGKRILRKYLDIPQDKQAAAGREVATLPDDQIFTESALPK